MPARELINQSAGIPALRLRGTARPAAGRVPKGDHSFAAGSSASASPARKHDDLIPRKAGASTEQDWGQNIPFAKMSDGSSVVERHFADSALELQLRP
jgi:hypothetical protein